MYTTHRTEKLPSALLEDIQPSLILSDISMPVMDGIQLFDAVRSNSIGVAIPFIFLTARGTRDDILVGKSMGADDYITKPVTSKELITAVKARLNRSNELMLVQMKEALKSSVFALAHAIEMRDEYTHAHMHRLNAICTSAWHVNSAGMTNGSRSLSLARSYTTSARFI